MSKEELFKQITNNLFRGFASIDNQKGTEDWFRVLVRGCIFPSEIARLRELCYVSMISYDVSCYCMELHCKYMSEHDLYCKYLSEYV